MYLEFTRTLALDAGNIIKSALKNSKKISVKCSHADLVTETDEAVEKFVRKRIQDTFPDHEFIGEESVAAGLKYTLTEKPTWMIDPIDGTTNFIHQFPFCCISIALLINKEVEVGVIYCPTLDTLYHAVKGEGAFMNNTPIHVSNTTALSSALVGAEFGSDRIPEVLHTKAGNMERIVTAAHGIRGIGSAAMNMCLVASGQTDAYFEFGVHCWDMAAGHIIVQEAGGISVKSDGSPMDLMTREVLCAANSTLANEISARIQRVPYERD